MALIRIVRMTFEEKFVDDFLNHFDTNKEKIRNFEGCLLLELWQDKHQLNIFNTYSHWESEDALNNYRKSALFGGVWKQTKKWFSDKPIAFSSQLKVKV